MPDLYLNLRRVLHTHGVRMYEDMLESMTCPLDVINQSRVTISTLIPVIKSTYHKI